MMLGKKLRRCPTEKLFVFFVGFCVILIYCEFLIYYVVIIQCSWPPLRGSADPLKALLVSDPHLLGPRRGHWLDKWRREGQMRTAFEAVLVVHAPEVVFFLGDLFDEGLWSRDSQFEEYVQRFRKTFRLPAGTEAFHVAGNHDMGFHHDITAKKTKRFEEQLGAPTVRLVTLKGNHIVLLNSMAMEGDSCKLCRGAVQKVVEISETLSCSTTSNSTFNVKCEADASNYSRPILMQHFPLYRASDAACSGEDLAPLLERGVPFRNKIDALSREATNFLTSRLQPRAAFGGHTHHGCQIQHDGAVAFQEYSVPSFSWRNRPDPKYYLVLITPEDMTVSKCSLPKETTIAATGILSLILLLCIVVRFNSVKRRFRRHIILYGS